MPSGFKWGMVGLERMLGMGGEASLGMWGVGEGGGRKEDAWRECGSWKW